MQRMQNAAAKRCWSSWAFQWKLWSKVAPGACSLPLSISPAPSFSTGLQPTSVARPPGSWCGGHPEDARRMPGYGHRSCWSCWAPGGAFFRCFSSGISIASDLMAVFIFFFWGGEETGAAQPAVAQMLACLFSLLGVAAPSYEKHGKNSARRGISAYFLPSVTLPASRLERRRVGACRWQRWLRREKALLERRERWAAPAASLVGLPGTSHSSGARYSKPGFLLTPPWAAVSPSLCPPPSPGVIFRGTVAPGGWREAGGPRGALARTERGPG